MTRYLLALALAAAPGASALDLASLLTGRIDKTASSMVEVEGECEDGYNAGYDYMQRNWRRERNSNCDNVWDLEDDADDIKDDRYPDNTSDWRTQSYNDCARNGVDDAVSAIEKVCLEDDSSQCIDLGEAAAEQVVINDWCSPSRSNSNTYGNSDRPNYKEECKDAAVSICEGNINSVVNMWSCEQPSTSELNDLMDECEDQVDGMVGDDDDDNNRRTPTRRPTKRPTRRPTKRPNSNNNRSPTRRPTRRPTKRPSNNDRDERCGRDEKCGSCKQAYCPDVSERKDCKDRYCSLEELALFFPEDIVANEE